MTERSYDNTKRAAQRAQTRQNILDVMLQDLSKGQDDVALAEVARRAGVSVRTVHTHFPDKASRIQAISAHIESKMGADAPGGEPTLPDHAVWIVDRVLSNETLIRAQMAPGLANAVRRERKREHIAHVTHLLQSAGWSRADAATMAATVVAVLSAEAVFDLRDQHGLTPAQIRTQFRLIAERLGAAPG